MKRRIVVLGGGISGYGSAILAKKEGLDTFLSDSGQIAERFRRRLDEWQVPYEEGGHTEELILSATEVVKSPGIPDTAPIVRRIREKGIPVISEIEFAGRYLDGARTICITGSNGKTTTTSLIYKIMRDAGMNAALGGNIGESFAYSVATERYDWYVLELSSFQLDGMYRFRADIGVLTNITPDHLDRYDHSFDKYAASKMRIVQNQTSRDAFVYSADDQTVSRLTDAMSDTMRMRRLPFATHTAIASGAGDAFCDGESFTAAVGDKSLTIDIGKMRIKGLHNTYNAMAAALATPRGGRRPREHMPVDIRVLARRAPFGAVRRGRRRGVCQRLEGHQRRLGVVRLAEHDAPDGVDRRRYGQGQRLRAVEEVRTRKGQGTGLHGAR